MHLHSGYPFILDDVIKIKFCNLPSIKYNENVPTEIMHLFYIYIDKIYIHDTINMNVTKICSLIHWRIYYTPIKMLMLILHCNCIHIYIYI